MTEVSMEGQMQVQKQLRREIIRENVEARYWNGVIEQQQQAWDQWSVVVTTALSDSVSGPVQVQTVIWRFMHIAQVALRYIYLCNLTGALQTS